MKAKLHGPLCIFLLLCVEAAAQPTCFMNYRFEDPCPPLNEIIFVGRVLSLMEEQKIEKGKIELSEVDWISGSMRGRAAVAVETALRGSVPEEVEFALFRSCYGRIEKGKRYVFHASRTRGGVDVYQWSEELDSQPEKANQLLDLIRSLINGEQQPRLSGQVQQLRYPAPNIAVIAEKDDKKIEAITQANGRYEFWELPDGEYKVYPLLPPSLRPSDDHLQPREDYNYWARVRNNEQCGARADFLAWPNGVIRGRVEDDLGAPVSFMKMNLIWLIDSKTRQGPSYPARKVLGLKPGEFAFVNLASGPYLLELVLLDSDNQVVTLYYPGGVRNQKEARVINLSAARKLNNLIIKLPRLRKK